jgi:hypothetical protein
MFLGRAARPRCFKNIDFKKLPVQWRSNKTAWMTARFFTDWLVDVNRMMQKQQRNILLCLDNAPCHPSDIPLSNIELLFFPANTISLAQPLDQGVIHTFKVQYRKCLVKHIIARCAKARSVDDIVISALDAVNWINLSWRAVMEATIQHTFRAAGKVVIDPNSS